MHVCLYIYIYGTCICIYIIYICIYIYMYIYICVCVRVCMCVCTFRCSMMIFIVNIYIYIYIHTQSHIYVYIYICDSVCSVFWMPICIYVIILHQQYLRGSNWLLTTVVAKGFPLVTPSDRLHMETEIHGHSAIETLDTRAMGVSCACHVNVIWSHIVSQLGPLREKGSPMGTP